MKNHGCRKVTQQDTMRIIIFLLNVNYFFLTTWEEKYKSLLLGKSRKMERKNNYDEKE